MNQLIQMSDSRFWVFSAKSFLFNNFWVIQKG